MKFAVAVVVAAGVAVGVAAQDARPAPTELSEGDGRDTVARVCVTACHPAAAIVRQRRSRAQWRAVINLMRFKGEMNATEEDLAVVLAYLHRHFGRVNPNLDPKADLETVLDISPEIAEAIVAYRQTHGQFTSLDDLARVDGLSAERLGALNDRIVFKGPY